jgi:hypothetical protein
MSDPHDVLATAPASGADGKRKRRMTARWRYTNRLNARASTGPKTADGKARVGRNALRHGLSVPALSDPGFAPEVVELAHRIAQSVVGQAVDGERHVLACRVAETIIDIRRVRLAKLPFVAQVAADLRNCAKPLAELWRLDRYERRTRSRRKRAAREFDAAVMELGRQRHPAERQNGRTNPEGKDEGFQRNAAMFASGATSAPPATDAMAAGRTKGIMHLTYRR